MLKIIQSELDKLHGKASPPSLFPFIPFTKSHLTLSQILSNDFRLYILHRSPYDVSLFSTNQIELDPRRLPPNPAPSGLARLGAQRTGQAVEHDHPLEGTG